MLMHRQRFAASARLRDRCLHVLNRNNRIGFCYKGKILVGESTVSTGKRGFSTPQGHYSVGSKDRDHYSSEFGDYVNNEGNVVVRISTHVKTHDRAEHISIPRGCRTACTLMAGMRCTKVTFRRSPPHTVVFDCQREWRRASYNAALEGTPVVVKE